MRYAKLVLATFLGLWAAVFAIHGILEFADYWQVRQLCAEVANRFPAPAGCFYSLEGPIGNVVIAFALGLATYLAGRFRDHRWVTFRRAESSQGPPPAQFLP